MYPVNTFSDQSPLIDAELEAQLTPLLRKLTGELTLCSIIDPEEETSRELAVFIRHFTRLSDKLSCEFYAPDENPAAEQKLNCPFLPATLLRRDGAFQNVSFHGIPGGKEINAFVLALYNCAGPGQKLSPFLKKKVQTLTADISLTVCVSLSCHHCANLVAVCQQMALLNPHIRACAIDARLYPKFVEAEKIERVPLLIINNDTRVLGDKSMEEVYALIKDL